MQSNEGESTLGRMAITLALTTDNKEELTLKEEYTKVNIMCAVTATGGEISLLAKKINNAVIGACLNNNVIEKTPEEIHAVIHASLEAKEGILLTAPSGASFVGKIAIVRRGRWIAVAIFGHSAMHFLTNHERIGLGIMHI